MDSVAALKDRHLCRRVKEVLQAHRAVSPHGILHAGVRFFDLRWIAAPASVAMNSAVDTSSTHRLEGPAIILTSSHSTDAALLTMKDLLLVTILKQNTHRLKKRVTDIIPEVALLTEVGREGNA